MAFAKNRAGSPGYDMQGNPVGNWQGGQGTPETMARDREMGYANPYNAAQNPTPITYMGKEMSEPDFKTQQVADAEPFRDLGYEAARANQQSTASQPAAFTRTPTPSLRNMMTQPQAQTPDQGPPQNNLMSNALMMLLGR